MRRVQLLAATALLVVSSFGVADAAGVAPSASSITGRLACARSIVSSWSLPRLANETVAVSVDAAHVGAMAPAAIAGFGGLLVFGGLAPLGFGPTVARLRAMSPPGTTMLVMTDEEGGGVRRLTNLVGAFPWAQTMGRQLRANQIQSVGERVGRQLLAVGVNVDLAPVVDLDGRAIWPGPTDPDGLRSFGASPALVASDATAFATGLARAGVLAVVKHFPGLGGATGNTDNAPAATRPWPELRAGALAPYRAAFAAGVSAVMVANARVPGLSAEPASLSPSVMRVLRESLGFRGLIMTDALSAVAISALGLSVPAAAVLAIGAGADLVLSGPLEPTASLALARATASALVHAVITGTFTRATLDEAAAEVVAARLTGACPLNNVTARYVSASRRRP